MSTLPPATIIERKIKPDGSVQEFPCELVWRSDTVVIVRFRLPHGGAAFNTPLDVPPGSESYGYFWGRRPYDLYRMLGPDGSVLGHRFEAVADVDIGEDMVSYRDLVLDWWVLPDGRLIEEDRDELEDLKAAGLISPRDVTRAEAAAKAVFSRYRRVIDEAAALLARHA